jgi:hypothetical protein
LNKTENAIASSILVAVLATFSTVGSNFQFNVYAQGIFDDDGEFVPDGQDQKQTEEQEQKQKQQQDYNDQNLPKYDKDTGTYNDHDNNGIDDDSKSNNNGLPICEYKVVQDCILNELGQICTVPTSEDACQDIFYGYDGDLKPGEKTFNNNNNDNDDHTAAPPIDNHMAAPPIKDSNNDGMDDSETPYCDLVRDAYPDYTGNCWDRKDYSDSTGLYPCRDGLNVADWRNCK